MFRITRIIKQHWRIFPVVALVVIVTGGLTYLMGTFGITQDRVHIAPIQFATFAPPLPGTPVAVYAQLDPAIVEYLESRPQQYGAHTMNPLGRAVVPIGAYLPLAGDTLTQTPIPTPLPYITATPLPSPQVRRTATPTPAPTLTATVVHTEYGTPRTLPYTAGASECAPSGNPAEGVLTQQYHGYHGGIDIGVPLGTPVLATHSGEVTYAGWSDIGYGYLVTLKSGAFETYYAHNTALNVAEGDWVGKGSIIAWSGSTGNSSGPHIHYEIRINNITVDPLTFSSRGYPTC